MSAGDKLALQESYDDFLDFRLKHRRQKKRLPPRFPDQFHPRMPWVGLNTGSSWKKIKLYAMIDLPSVSIAKSIDEERGPEYPNVLVGKDLYVFQ